MKANIIYKLTSEIFRDGKETAINVTLEGYPD